MSREVGQFSKVPFNIFKEGIKEAYERCSSNIMKEYAFYTDDDKLEEIYRNIKLPERATKRSAGYDFFYPFGETLLVPGEHIIIPTGIRVWINDRLDMNWFLGIYTKSGLGFNNRIKQDDTTAIIDADYYFSDNKGHILLSMRNEHRDKTCNIRYHDKIAQGIFQIYGTTYDDNATGERNGGFGSTSI